jgi:ABC-type molybdate transport system permease subunit
MSLATVVLAEAAHFELPFPPIVFGIIAIIAFGALGFVTFSYRHVANRHNDKNVRPVPGHGGSHGA